MNTSNVKKYAPKARKAFIEAITKQAAKYGITKKKMALAKQEGDLVVIDGIPFPAGINESRERLVKRVEQQGFDQVIEHVAYSWFNRLCAIRYMELKDFLDHGRRVLSSADGSAGMPQILEEFMEVTLPELDKAEMRKLKLDGTQDEALYRKILLAQCHALHQAMPFLFESVDNEAALLLPDNLIKTNSLIRDMVTSIPDDDWNDVEIIGWLYQFYISEKKDQVIGKIVKSEDIPAATQLFTPNWIVQYLVQNSVGRQWLQSYPDSSLKKKMPYYIEPAEQTAQVQKQIKAITPSEITPESIKVLDPACGSGHILVEAYKVLKAIYEERGYRTRDIPQLILKNNLFGLDIDDRAGQLAGFALMMLAREDNRRIFSSSAAERGELKLNVLSLQESTAVNLPSLWQALNLSGECKSGTSHDLFAEPGSVIPTQAGVHKDTYELLERTLKRFTQAKTFGSLIDVPNDEYDGLQELFSTLKDRKKAGDSMQKSAATTLIPYVHQALLLAQKYDAVIANPPYMGNKYLIPEIKKELKNRFAGYEKDLFSAFIIRNIQLTKQHGQLGFMTPFVWMFISSYEQLRSKLISNEVISTLVQLEYSGFDGATVPICTFTLTKGCMPDYTSSYIRLSDFRGAVNQGPKVLEAISNRACGWFYEAKQDDFKKIPGSPIAYWVANSIRKAFINGKPLGDMVPVKYGLKTADNERFLRFWSEVSISKIGLGLESQESATASNNKWFPSNKGGKFRKWYGNNEYVVNWERDGYEVRNFFADNGKFKPAIPKIKFYFRKSITWSLISSAYFGVRYSDSGAIFDIGGPSAFPTDKDLFWLTGLLCSKQAFEFMKIMNPTLNFPPGNVASLPILEDKIHPIKEELNNICSELIQLHKDDWNAFETSWNFKRNPIIRKNGASISADYINYLAVNQNNIARVVLLEEKVNQLLINAYQLSAIITPHLPKKQTTLTVNSQYRYSLSDDEEAGGRFQYDSIGELISYCIGCMMGRYCLDKEGLVYAHSANIEFAKVIAEGTNPSFPADDDGIIMLSDQEWFPDDATNRFSQFVSTVWGTENLHKNLAFVAESLCLHTTFKPKKSESAMDTIRRYFSTQFYKNHLTTYKKRPIYWLFSSGKQKAFECLVYLHRYNASTLSRMRTEYVIPLTAKMTARIKNLENDKAASDSAAEVKRLEKDTTQLRKQQIELREFDEKLRHCADHRISLDLDDGVKVNYAKFGDLLANVKDITDKAPEVLL